MAEKTGSKRPSHSPQSAASYVRRSAEAMRARGAAIHRQISVHASEYAALAEWAASKNSQLPFSHVDQFRAVSQGAEHLVYHDRFRALAVKVTHANRFGHSADGVRLAATPLEYLRRLGWHNALFGDDILIEGVAYDGEQMEVITSQPWIVAHPTSPRPTQDELDAYFQGILFEKALLNPEAPLYFNRSVGVVIMDAHDQNVLRDENGLLTPIDVVVGRPGVLLQKQIDLHFTGCATGSWPTGISPQRRSD